MQDKKGGSTGFTLVELLIVVVLISILAAVTTVAYSGMRTRANNASRIAAGDQWFKHIRLYSAQYGNLPPSLTAAADGTKYCLGTGFPIGGGGVARCQNVTGTDSNSPLESDNATLISELASFSKVPTIPPIRATVTGPYVMRVSSTVYWIVIALEGSYTAGSTCGGGYVSSWTNASDVSTCYKQI